MMLIVFLKDFFRPGSSSEKERRIPDDGRFAGMHRDLAWIIRAAQNDGENETDG
jgi:hypothetical protein